MAEAEGTESVCVEALVAQPTMLYDQSMEVIGLGIPEPESICCRSNPKGLVTKRSSVEEIIDVFEAGTCRGKPTIDTGGEITLA